MIFQASPPDKNAERILYFYQEDYVFYGNLMNNYSYFVNTYKFSYNF